MHGRSQRFGSFAHLQLFLTIPQLLRPTHRSFRLRLQQFQRRLNTPKHFCHAPIKLGVLGQDCGVGARHGGEIGFDGGEDLVDDRGDGVEVFLRDVVDVCVDGVGEVED
jgi:hypothetical protein